MKVISYIILSIAGFFIGLASYFIINEERIKKRDRERQLAKAREIKKIISMERKKREEQSGNDNFQEELEELENKIIEEHENGSTKEKTIDN